MHEEPAPEEHHFTIRQATLDLFESICIFYQNHPAPYLPVPDVVKLADAIDDGRLFIVQDYSARSEIVAATAIFDYAPRKARTLVYELSGTRVTSDVGGLGPLNLQCIFIALRLGQLVSQEEHLLKVGLSQSLVAIVNEDNETSDGNLKLMGLIPMQEPLPSWIDYDNLTWLAPKDKDKWKFYYADDRSVQECLKILFELGIDRKFISLTRINRSTGKKEKFVFWVDIHSFETLYILDLKAIADGVRAPHLTPPPQRLIF